MRSVLREAATAWVMVMLAITVPLLLLGQGLQVRLVGDELRLSATSLQLIEGAVLERLKNGAPVPISLSLSVSADSRTNILQRISERIILSYDLWEEKFAATNPDKKRGSVLYRSPLAAENWCLDQLVVKTADLPSQRQLWFRVEVRPENGGDDELAGSLSLRGLVDAFGKSRPPGPKRIVLEAGPFRVADLRQTVPTRRYATAQWIVSMP